MREDWVEVELGSTCDFVGGGTPSKKETSYWNGNIPWASIKDIKGSKLTRTQYFISEEGLNNSSANVAEIGELIIGTRINPGRPILTKIRTAINQDLKIVKPKMKLDTLFLFYAFKELEKDILKLSSGTTVLGINLNNLRSIRFNLPPLPIQRAIVAKIETLFSDLDNGITDLKKAQEQLKIYRQAVLKKAFEGELTKAWREQCRKDAMLGVSEPLPTAEELLAQIKQEQQNWLESEISNGNNEAKRIKTKLKKSTFKPSNNGLPAKWSWTTFIHTCLFVIDCHNKTAPYEKDGIYLVRTTNIRNGKLDLENKIKYVSEDTYQFWSRRAFPKTGDIIFTIEAPMGEAAIIPKDTKICLGQRTMLLRTIPSLLENKYLLYNILSEVFQQRMRDGAIGTGVKHLRVGDVENLSFPLCSKQEQHQIVREIEARLSVCDKV